MGLLSQTAPVAGGMFEAESGMLTLRATFFHTRPPPIDFPDVSLAPNVLAHTSESANSCAPVLPAGVGGKQRGKRGAKARKWGHPSHAAAGAEAGWRHGRAWYFLAELFAVGALAVLAVMHLASVPSNFRMIAGLHRWLMSYADGYHRRGLVGTIFQFFVGDEPRKAQIALASEISLLGVYSCLIAVFAVFVYAAARIGDHALRRAAWCFAALMFVNPMWTTRAFDNGYLDWLADLSVIAALVAFLCKRPRLSGAIIALAVIAYWGTLFVWLPLGFLIFCVLARDAMSKSFATHRGRIAATCKQRAAYALWLPLLAASLSVLFHDNDAAIAQLDRIGGQEHIIAQTFSGIWTPLVERSTSLVHIWRQILSIALIFALPPVLCSGLWVYLMHQRGRSLFAARWLDISAAIGATLAPLSFLMISFDLSRTMAWTYLGSFVVMIFWLMQVPPERIRRTLENRCPARLITPCGAGHCCLSHWPLFSGPCRPFTFGRTCRL